MSKYVLIVPSKLYLTRHIVKTFLERSRSSVQHSTVYTAVNHNRCLIEEWTRLNETCMRNIKGKFVLHEILCVMLIFIIDF